MSEQPVRADEEPVPAAVEGPILQDELRSEVEDCPVTRKDLEPRKKSHGGLGILVLMLFVLGLVASAAIGGYNWGHESLSEETRMQIRTEEVARVNANAKRAEESIKEQAYLRGMGDGAGAAVPIRAVLSCIVLTLILFVIRRFDVGYGDMSKVVLVLLLSAVASGGYFAATDPGRVNKWWHTLTAAPTEKAIPAIPALD